jgi:hypothetical protein
MIGVRILAHLFVCEFIMSSNFGHNVRPNNFDIFLPVKLELVGELSLYLAYDIN